jgi:hypothetical protein
LTHDTLIVGFMQVNRFFEFFFQSLHCWLKMGPLLDELFLLIDTIHFLLVFLLDIFAVNFNNFWLEGFIVLRLKIKLRLLNCGTYRWCRIQMIWCNWGCLIRQCWVNWFLFTYRFFWKQDPWQWGSYFHWSV